MSLTVALIVKNSEKVLGKALESARFADQIVVVDNRSTDRTVEIAKKYTDKIQVSTKESFAARRNQALDMATADWIFYLDADEVISPELKEQLLGISQNTSDPKVVAYSVKRENHFLQEKMYPDYIERLFFTSTLKEWRGRVHEHAVYEGKSATIEAPLTHFTHADITSMLKKTNRWSEVEAELRLEANHPPMKWWRLIRIAITTLWQQLVGKKLYRYGRAGIFEAYFQMIDKLVVYTKLWEKQQKQQ